MLRFSDGDFASGLEEDKTAEGKDSLIGSLDEETDLLPTGVLDLEVRVTLGEAVEELALKEDDRNTPCLRILLADFSSSVCIDNSFFICCSMCIARRRRVCVGPKIFIAFSISTSCDWELPDEENEEEDAEEALDSKLVSFSLPEGDGDLLSNADGDSLSTRADKEDFDCAFL